ncbi:MAG TPA: hypothetical protein P5102_08635 [Candidatus Competibacteraceae bacterium]|nr:hypothetical protein [Candidatus Competibacteraceae bacterium]HRZ06205.1 hypothetical protein [Candidatus Competibacteraceae bacterium]HSA47911.1 hypothetical protein [Candidatus Competibacteraceae bacterium]
MNKVSRYSWNAALALTLTLGSSVILAKGPGTYSPQDQAKVEYRCSSTAGSTGATAKSPNGHLSYSCVPVTSVQTTTPPGTTTAKTPGKPDGHLLTRESTRSTIESGRCTAEC